MKGAGGTSGGVGLFLGGAAMVVAGGYLLLTRVVVSGGAWRLYGYDAFGLSLAPLLIGIGLLFFNGRSIAGWVLAAAGALIIVVGIIANLHVYFQPSSLFDTLVILTLIAGGIGLSRPLAARKATALSDDPILFDTNSAIRWRHPMPTLAIAIFVAVFAIATFRNIHLGVLMLPAACAVGVWLAGMSLRDIVAGFPVGILVLIAGITYLFGIAKGNGTIDLVVQTLLAAVGARRGLLPFVFFLITAAVAAMGSPQAGYVVMPLAMPAARRSGVDPMLMAVAINSGISPGGLAPTSLFGIVTNSTARQAGITLNPLILLAAAMVANLALLAAATWLFPESSLATALATSQRSRQPQAHDSRHSRS